MQKTHAHQKGPKDHRKAYGRGTHQTNKQPKAGSSNTSKAVCEMEIQKIDEQPNGRSSRNKYALQFFQESREELLKRKEEAFNSIEPVSHQDQEISDDYYPQGIDMPKRPAWDYKMTKEQLEMMEQRYFTVRTFAVHIILIYLKAVINFVFLYP